MLRRLALTWLVGSVTTAVAPVALVAALFGELVSAVVGLAAASWQHSGGSLGRWPLVWTAAGGLAFLLGAAAASRPTSIPAGILVVGMLVFAVVRLVPEGAFAVHERGCIAQSAEEADRIGP